MPASPVTIAIALADKLDQLAGFFAVGEKPTGSGDPYALRRAGLGVIRIIRDNALRIALRALIHTAADGVKHDVPGTDVTKVADEIMVFIAERLRVQLRGEGARHDVLSAVFATASDDDLLRVLARSEALAAFLGTEDGNHLLAAYKRAVNILRIEERKDGPHDGAPDADGLMLPEEHALHTALQGATEIEDLQRQEIFTASMAHLAALRAPLDAFFDKVTVNAPDPALRVNRLRLLAGVRGAMNQVADFSAIEG